MGAQDPSIVVYPPPPPSVVRSGNGGNNNKNGSQILSVLPPRNPPNLRVCNEVQPHSLMNPMLMPPSSSGLLMHTNTQTGKTQLVQMPPLFIANNGGNMRPPNMNIVGLPNGDSCHGMKNATWSQGTMLLDNGAGHLSSSELKMSSLLDSHDR